MDDVIQYYAMVWISNIQFADSKFLNGCNIANRKLDLFLVVLSVSEYVWLENMKENRTYE